MTDAEIRLALLSWQSWWQEYGADWYEDSDCPQAEKPPVLSEAAPVFGLWLGDDDGVNPTRRLTELPS